MDLQGKVVLVSGASRGIGRAIAEACAQQGASVVLVARTADMLEEAEHALRAQGHDIMAVAADIADPQSVQALVMEVGVAYGRVDALINNAAVAMRKPFLQTTPEEWQAMTNVNLHGMYALVQAFLPGMIERRAGVIVNMSAAVARNGFPELAVYSGTKAAIIAYTEALAKEVRRYGVQVYAICPHGVNTDMYRTLFGASDPAKVLSPERVAQDVVRVVTGEVGIRSGQTLEISL